MISAPGVSLILHYLVQIGVSPQPLSFGRGILIPTDSGVKLGVGQIHASRFLVIGVTVILMLGLAWFVQHSRLRRAVRTVSIDMDAAAMMGVDDQHVCRQCVIPKVERLLIVFVMEVYVSGFCFCRTQKSTW